MVPKGLINFVAISGLPVNAIPAAIASIKAIKICVDSAIFFVFIRFPLLFPILLAMSSNVGSAFIIAIQHSSFNFFFIFLLTSSKNRSCSDTICSLQLFKSLF